MPTDLAQFIQETPLCNTHEHLRTEQKYVEGARTFCRVSLRSILAPIWSAPGLLCRDESHARRVYPRRDLSALLVRYLDAHFVLMHTACPYGNEPIALAKHYANVYMDLCWAWSINPFSIGS